MSIYYYIRGLKSYTFKSISLSGVTKFQIMAKKKQIDPFAVKDCALIAIATGIRAQNLRELKDKLQTVSYDCIYYHFWGGLLRPRFDDPEYHNDFSVWARHGLNDKILAERLSIIDPTEFGDLEDLRHELIDIIEERLDELEFPPLSKYDNQFEFIRSQIVIFDTRLVVNHPRELRQLLPNMSLGSIFYHFIDAVRRTDNGLDDFQNWIMYLGDEYEKLCLNINEIDPYFASLVDLRHRLTGVFANFFRDGR